MMVVEWDASTTTTANSCSMALRVAPDINVHMCHPQCGRVADGHLSEHCFAVLIECGVELWVPEGVDDVFISCECL